MTNLLFVPFDAEKTQLPNLEPADFEPEYVRELKEGEEAPKTGDFTLYSIDGNHVVRRVVHRIFVYEPADRNGVMLFVE
jgi:hypothetical protein